MGLNYFKVNENFSTVNPPKKIMSLYVASACNLACEECIMQHIMKADKKYQMSMDEIEAFIDASEKSDYKFHFILTGGEPLLWKHLEEGLIRLRNSSIVNDITIFTNGLVNKKITQTVVDNVDSLRISEYLYNKEEIIDLQKKFGDKIKVVDRTEFWENPHKAVPEKIALPVFCLNAECLYYNYRVYACPHGLSIAKHNGSLLDISKPIEPNFLSGMFKVKACQAKEICTWCISNRSVREHVAKVTNISLGKEIPDGTDSV